MKQLLTLYFLITITTYAQKELWGVNNDTYVPLSGAVYYGNITKYDINGQNPEKMHEFNSIDGSNPNCKLFLASNGKIYGTTLDVVSNTPFSYSVFFEYDPILNKYRTISNFAPYIFLIAKSGLIEPVPGKLYGCFANRVFSYDLLTEAITLSTNITGGSVLITGELFKASNGFLYGTTTDYASCPSTIATGYYAGGLFRYNMINNTIQMLHDFKCDFTEGGRPIGSLVEATQGKLYGLAYGGGGIIDGVFTNLGTLFEFNTLTNVFTKKITFDDDNLGKNPTDLTIGTNGKLYGVCQNGGTNVFTNPNNGITYTTHNGTLFEYTPATNTIIKLHDFGTTFTNGMYSDTGSHPLSLTKTSNGYYMGTSEYNPFKFDPANNTVVNTLNGNIPFNTNRLLNFIEICRKPSYQEFLPNTYAPAVGTAFTFNVQNTNATTYVWKKGTTILPAQTTGILNLPNVTTSDTGVYTCTMTNECGTTVTANLNINVTNLAVETVDDYKSQISLYPNPTKGILNLKFPENRGLKGYNYKITNLLGQIIEEKDISNSSKSELTINTSSYAYGVYQITLVTDKGNWNGKFVKE